MLLFQSMKCQLLLFLYLLNTTGVPVNKEVTTLTYVSDIADIETIREGGAKVVTQEDDNKESKSLVCGILSNQSS